MSSSGTRICSRCGLPGHNIQTCEVAPGHAVVIGIDLSSGYGQWQPDCTECGWTGSWHTDRNEALSEAGRHNDDTRG